MNAKGTLITYKILKDRGDKLKAAARMACNFWNHFIQPERSIVIHMGLITSRLDYIALSYEPERRGRVTHGCIRFNTRYLAQYDELQIAGTLVHELGHTLGFGWDRWMALFDGATGRFLPNAVKRLPALARMRVETDYGAGTQHLHWDEHRHGGELMTGIENKHEYVLPITVDVTALLGHRVQQRLARKTPVPTLLKRLRDTPFTRRRKAKTMTAEHIAPKRVWERIHQVAAKRR